MQDNGIVEHTPFQASDPAHGRMASAHTRHFAFECIWLAALSVAAFLVLGYHPYAEDGGIYAAALAHRLYPALFPSDGEWVDGHTRFSLFVPVFAQICSWTHLSLGTALLLLQLAGMLCTLLAAFLLARLCFQRAATARWATVLFASCAGMPIAGTSLYLLDPYVTARTVTTPLLLFAAGLALRRRWLAAAMCWVAAAAVHPLMGMWGVLPLVLLWLGLRSGKGRQALWRQRTALAGFVLLSMGVLLAMSSAASPLARTVALTRGYWFLSAWRWYELVGAALPCAMLAAGAARRHRMRWTQRGAALATAACTSAAVGMAAALLFAHADGRSFAVARLQPLRTLHWFYAAFLLLLSGSLYEWTRDFLGNRRLAWSGGGSVRSRRSACKVRSGLAWLLPALAATGMFFAQRGLYPASGVVEWPWRVPQNGWEQAFLWIRENTAVEERVALDARYTEVHGEDAQGFRALALRSTLPDAAKDGGVAAVVPTLQQSWLAGVTAQTGLNGAYDRQRIERLAPFGIHVLVLPASAQTAFSCPYRNTAAKVCRLP